MKLLFVSRKKYEAQRAQTEQFMRAYMEQCRRAASLYIENEGLKAQLESINKNSG